jgi:aminoglycoside phosphotransferase
LNIATTFLTENWPKLGLGRMTSPERVSWMVLTPKFPASSHVIFLLLCEDVPGPILVLKVARLPGEDYSLTREAANLLAVQQLREGGFNSVPRILAFKSRSDNSILVETALVGVQMDPALVRRRTEWCIEMVLHWLIDFHSSTALENTASPDWFFRLVQTPLARLESVLLPSRDDEELIGAVRAMAAVLRGAKFPLVFSHGDLSDPNILILNKGGVGIVDWEMAEPHSLPASDLFFFLNFIASAQRPLVRVDDVAAFRHAFFTHASWAVPYVSRYAEAMSLPVELLKPLFVLCFTRYLSEVIVRMSGSKNYFDRGTSAWLRSDRSYVLWREAVENAGKLTLV